MLEDFELDKITAAVLQLEAAFQLMIDSPYDEAAFTLISASKAVVRDCSLANGFPFYRDTEEPFIKLFAEEGGNFFKGVNHPANFLKHADRDHDETLDQCDFIELNENGIISVCLGIQDFFDTLPDRLAIAYATCAYAQSQNANGYDVIGHAREVGQDEAVALEMMMLPRGELYKRAKVSWLEAEPSHLTKQFEKLRKRYATSSEEASDPSDAN